MSVFMISPKAVVTPKSDVPDTDAKKGVEVETTPDPIMGEKARVDEFVMKKELDESRLTIDGPLSQVYTQALNQIYAKEDYEFKEVTGIPSDSGIYLYAIDRAHLEADPTLAMESFNEGRRGASQVLVCVEHDMQITPSVASFIGSARQQGATILLDRQQTLKMFKDKLGR